MGGRVRFKSRPAEIEAIQWKGDVNDLADLGGAVYTVDEYGTLSIWIEKSKCMGTVFLGDWIICEHGGVGFYPCVDSVFQQRWVDAE